MKKVLLIALAITMVASVSMADEISVFADNQGTSCNFVGPAGPSPVTFYVVHKTVNGATGSQFKIVNSTAWTLSPSVLGGFLSIGDAYTNLSLAYGGCLAGPNIAVVQLAGFAFPAPGDPCMQVSVVAAPNTVGILTIDCTFAEIPALTGGFTINGDALTCPCGPPNATEQSTWGKVKSLYR